MERSDALIKLVSVIVFIALAVYLGYAIYNSQTDTLRTVMAVAAEYSDGISTEGYAVRDEEVLTASSGSVIVTAEEGAKVANGATVARSYSGTAALERAESIRELELQIEQIEDALNGKTTSESARESVISLSEAVSTGDLDSLDAILLDVETYITGSGVSEDTEELNATLAELEEELDALQSSGGGTKSVTAPFSGLFSSTVDGFEGVGPDDFSSSTTPDEMRELFSEADSVSDSAFGKLVSGIRWYYVTILDKQSAAKLSSLSTVNVEFSMTYSGTINMTIEYLGAVDDNGECVVVLSSSEYMQDTIALRSMVGKLITADYSGLQVPKEAVHVDDDGETYIYLLKGLQAERVDVTILSESGDYYIVSDEDTELRSGDEIITRAAVLYDGAVVAD